MNALKIALRNTLRNRRRSSMTVLAIAVGAFALLVFGAFVTNIQYGMQTDIVRTAGHIHIHKKGFFDYGAGRVTDYDIADYQEVINTIKSDPTLSPWVSVITPVLQVGGIAGNYDENSSQGFSGIGVVPAQQIELRNWDGFTLNNRVAETYPLAADEASRGFIGEGLARILSLCDELTIANCKDATESLGEGEPNREIASFTELANDDPSAAPQLGTSVDLLASSASGAPNIVSLPLIGFQQQSQKALDDRFIAMPLTAAQSLIYGRGEKRVSSIVIQLKQSELMTAAITRLQQLVAEQNLHLEIKSLDEFSPFYGRVLKMFGTIFGFISLVISMVVLFTIINTMTMSVMERYGEIGTLRSMGLRRWGVRRQFVVEGTLLGLIGATLGLFAAVLVAYLVNQLGVTWTPPSSSGPQLLTLQLTRNPLLVTGVWSALLIVPMLASLIPAGKAARLPIVDALRHV